MTLPAEAPQQTELSRRITERADADGLAPDHELRTLAAAFDAANAGYWGDPQTVPVNKFMGAYARCRRAWCAYSGEPLI